jgi:hypothetical protein
MPALGKIVLIEDELTDGVIPHGGKNDAAGSFLCPACLDEQHMAWLALWAGWHQVNGYTEVEFTDWAEANDVYPNRYGWVSKEVEEIAV